MAIKHLFTNPIADGTNTQIVRPSDWNDNHVGTYILSAGTQTAGSNATVVFSDFNNVSFGISANSIITATASLSQYNQAVSANNGSSSFQTLSFADSNGVSFSTGSQGLYATVATNYQSQGAYLTTAALSQDSSKYAGVNGAITGGSITVNTSGVSVNLPAYLTTAALSQNSSKYAGVNGAITGGSITVNTSGVSVNLPAYLTTARASTDAVGLNTAATNVTWTVNSSGISLNAGGYLTTAMASNAATISNIKVSAGTASANLSALTFADLNNISFGFNGSTITATATLHASVIPVLGNFTEEANVQEMINDGLGAGWIAGGGFSTQTSGSTITVASGEGWIRGVDSPTANLSYCSWNSATISCPNSGVRYIAVDYNAGTPIVSFLTTQTTSPHMQLYLGEFHLEGGSITAHNDKRMVGDFARRDIDWISELFGIRVISGEITSDASPASRKIKVTGGVFWDRHKIRYTDSDVDTNAGGTFMSIYRDGGTNWVRTIGQTQWDNLQYDDGSGTLATITGSNWANCWVIRSFAGNVYVQYGQAQYTTQAEAEAEARPSTRPEEVEEHGFYVARITFQYTAASPASIDTSLRPTISGSSGSGADAYNMIAAGSSTAATTGTIIFSNSNGVSFGLNGATVTATVATNYQSQGAYLTTAMASNAATISNIKVSAGTLSANRSDITFADSNGISWGLNTDGVITGTIATNYQSQGNYLTTAALSQDSSKYAGINGAITGGSITVNTSGVSVNLPAYLSTQSTQYNAITLGGNIAGTTSFNATDNNSLFLYGGNNVTLSGNGASITISGANVGGAQTGISGIGVSDTTYSSGTVIYSGQNNITIGSSVNGASQYVRLSVGNYLTTAMLSNANTISNINISGGTTSSNLSAINFVNSNGVSWSLDTSSKLYATVATNYQSQGAYLTTARASTDAVGLNTAGTNVTWTVNSSGISLNAGGYLTTAMASNAATISNIKVSAGTLSVNRSDITFANSNNVSFGLETNGVITASAPNAGAGNITISAGTTNNGLANVSFANSNGISFGLNGSTITAIQGYLSSYENQVFVSNVTQSVSAQSLSVAVAFNLPQPISASFLRIPCVMTTNSTTLSTAAASLSGSAEVYSTYQAVVYSMGTGASSKSLISVASGWAGWTMRNSISVAADGTSGSYTQAISGYAAGVGTTRTTQYTVAGTNYSYTTNQILTEWSGSRFIDINFVNSLSAGAYWLVWGLSTNSASNSARISAATNCRFGYATHHAISQGNINFGIMGSTNLTSGGLLGAGSFSTAGGGTTSAFHISAISSSASNLRPYFQLLRSV